MKSLCNERFQDWSTKFAAYELKCMELTGDTELDDFADLFDTNLICTTPVILIPLVFFTFLGYLIK